MGDRFSFGIADESGDVLYLYSHWGGATWDSDLKNAIYKAGMRSNAPDYANRILLSQLIGKNWDSDGGFGISINNVPDTEYPFVPIVDFKRSTITFYEFNNELGDKLVELSIIQFMNATLETLVSMIVFNRGLYDVTV